MNSFRMQRAWGPLLAAMLVSCSAARSAPPLAMKTVEPEVESPTDERYATLPKPEAAAEWTPPEARKVGLENGLSIWSMTHGNAPLVSIHMVLPTGGSSDPKGKAGLTMLAADLLDEGAGNFSALELNDRLGELATDYGSQAGVDYVLLSMNALAENLESSLALLADIVQRPQLKKEEFERRKEHYRATALAAKDSPRSARSLATARVLFGHGYASNPVSGTVESLSAITYTDAKRQARRLAVPDGAHLVIAGDVDEKPAKELADKYFSQWKGKRKKTDVTVENRPTGGNAYVIDFDGASQSAISVAMRAGGNDDPNYYAEEVMHQKLGGSFDGRINLNLREDKGYTYGARSSFTRYEKGGTFAINTLVKRETTGASLKEIFKELSDVCGGRPLSEKERNSSVGGMLLGYPLDFDQVQSVGYRLASLPVRNRSVDFWTTWPDKIRQITTARINEAARPYCDPSKYNVIVAGDLKVIRRQLEKFEFDVVELDREGAPLLPKDSPKKFK